MLNEVEKLVSRYDERRLTRRELVAGLLALVAAGRARPAAAQPAATQVAQARTINHFCLGVDDYDADSMAAALDAQDIQARVDRNPRNRTSGGDQLYFSDPDGTTVQLAANGYQG